MKTVTINGEKVEYKSTHAALREYEKLFGKPSHEIKDYTDTTNLMYAITKTQFRYSGIEFTLTIDEFIEYLDKHPEALEGFVLEAEQETDKEKKS